MSDEDPILVFGAGGLFGSYVVPELIKRGGKVRGAVHHEAGAAVARANGASEIAMADLRDEPALRRALEGVKRVYYIPPKFLPDEAEVGVRLVELAAETGVEHFVLSGVIYPFIRDMGNHWSKIAV